MCVCPARQHWSRSASYHWRTPPSPVWMSTRASIYSVRPLVRLAGATPQASRRACRAASAIEPISRALRSATPAPVCRRAHWWSQPGSAGR
eukprot:10679721-Lingulodinium_polyedra.AAC.1